MGISLLSLDFNQEKYYKHSYVILVRQAVVTNIMWRWKERYYIKVIFFTSIQNQEGLKKGVALPSESRIILYASARYKLQNNDLFPYI